MTEFTDYSDRYVDGKVSTNKQGMLIGSFETMPMADSTTKGCIVLYTGTPTKDYKKDTFYVCSESGGGHVWEAVDLKVPKLSAEKGSTSVPVYVDENGEVKACGDSLDVNISKNAATATKATGDAKGQAITGYVKSISISGRTVTITKGDGTTSTQTTQDTNTPPDHKVAQTIAADSVDRPLLLKDGTGTGNLSANPTRFDSDVYVNSSTGVLTAKGFKGPLDGKATSAGSADHATKANQDGKGNVIADTYRRQDTFHVSASAPTASTAGKEGDLWFQTDGRSPIDNELDEIRNEVNTRIAGVYRVKGSCAFNDLPKPVDATIGDVWNLTNPSEKGPIGTNVVWTGTEWDALGGITDLHTYLQPEGVTGISPIAVSKVGDNGVKISHANSGVVAGSIGDWNVIPKITINSTGHISKKEIVSIAPYVKNIGDDHGSKQFTITHNFNTTDVFVQVMTSSVPRRIVYVDTEIVDVNTVALKFNTAPTPNQFRVIISRL